MYGVQSPLSVSAGGRSQRGFHSARVQSNATGGKRDTKSETMDKDGGE